MLNRKQLQDGKPILAYSLRDTVRHGGKGRVLECESGCLVVSTLREQGESSEVNAGAQLTL